MGRLADAGSSLQGDGRTRPVVKSRSAQALRPVGWVGAQRSGHMVRGKGEDRAI
jgi:hypothetical protein